MAIAFVVVVALVCLAASAPRERWKRDTRSYVEAEYDRGWNDAVAKASSVLTDRVSNMLTEATKEPDSATKRKLAYKAKGVAESVRYTQAIFSPNVASSSSPRTRTKQSQGSVSPIQILDQNRMKRLGTLNAKLDDIIRAKPSQKAT
jgi:hypothetical protein